MPEWFFRVERQTLAGPAGDSGRSSSRSTTTSRRSRRWCRAPRGLRGTCCARSTRRPARHAGLQGVARRGRAPARGAGDRDGAGGEMAVSDGGWWRSRRWRSLGGVARRPRPRATRACPTRRAPPGRPTRGSPRPTSTRRSACRATRARSAHPSPTPSALKFHQLDGGYNLHGDTRALALRGGPPRPPGGRRQPGLGQEPLARAVERRRGTRRGRTRSRTRCTAWSATVGLAGAPPSASSRRTGSPATSDTSG